MSAPVPHKQHEGQTVPVSFATFAETTSTRRFNFHAYQKAFPDICAAYFRGTGLSAVEIACMMGVDQRTAQLWLDGVTAPRGDKIARIALEDPAGFARHFGAAA